jgi:hypothetical protein
MRHKIPDVEGRIPTTAKIEINQENPIFVNDDVVLVKVSVDGYGVTPVDRRCYVYTPFEYPGYAIGPLGRHCRRVRQIALEQCQLVIHGVLSGGWWADRMDLVRSFGDPFGQCRCGRCGQEFTCGPARHLALDPHMKRRNDAERLRDRNAVVAVVAEAAGPECIDTSEIIGSIVPRSDLTNCRARLEWHVTPVDRDVVLDDTPSVQSVSCDACTLQAHRTAAGQSREAIELFLDVHRIERGRNPGELRVGTSSKRIHY